MATKGKLPLIFSLLFCLLLVSATLALGKQDPELKQCKHQCKHQQRYDKRQQQECEERCEQSYREKQGREKEREQEEGGDRGGSIFDGEWNPQSPEGKLRQCQRQCESREEQQRPECRRRCVEQFKREQEGGGGGYDNPRGDPEKQYRECREQCRSEHERREKREQCESKCEEQRREREREGEGNTEEEERERGQGEEENNPYVFEDQHFTTKLRTDHGRLRILQKFTQRSKLLRGIENYRVEILEADPQTFILPKHTDAESLFYVANGRGTISLVRPEKRQSFNIKCGDVLRIPAGTTSYMINRDNREKLVLAELLQPVSIPGNFEAFFGAGGENPESYYKAFSMEVLEAAFNTRREKLQKLFGQQRQGIIIKASEEQIRALSKHEEGGIWPFGGESKGPFNLLQKSPSKSNEHGRLYEVDANDFRQLEDLDMAVSFANITKGSMLGPFYNSKATKIAIVVKGEGRLEMACPHLAQEWGGRQEHEGSRGQSTGSPSYKKVRAKLRCGTVYVVPAGHPIVTIASNNQNLEIICFDVSARNNEKFLLAGKRNVYNQLEREAKELAFGVKWSEVEEVFRSQEEEWFFKGPRQQQQQQGRADE